MRTIQRRVTGLILTLISTIGCMLSTALPPTAVPAATATPSGWRELAPGMEQRQYQPEGNLFGGLSVLRIDPARFTFRAHYQPGAPLTLNGWQQTLPNAVAFVNANFFSPDHTILGLLVADGVVYGQSYQNQGGTFLVQNGQPRVRSNIREPYVGEVLEQAVQAFPMLVLDGQTAYQPSRSERISRRTVVAQDDMGRILLMVTPLTGLTLEALSTYLPTTDMGIVTALNLDGGGSTMVYANPPGSSQPVRLPSLDAVPAVLAVYSR